MKLYIDNREPKAIIDYLEFINNNSKKYPPLTFHPPAVS